MLVIQPIVGATADVVVVYSEVAGQNMGAITNLNSIIGAVRYRVLGNGHRGHIGGCTLRTILGEVDAIRALVDGIATDGESGGTSAVTYYYGARTCTTANGVIADGGCSGNTRELDAVRPTTDCVAIYSDINHIRSPDTAVTSFGSKGIIADGQTRGTSRTYRYTMC
ncbi:unnamed protein product, partial [marine sediment metagenome]